MTGSGLGDSNTIWKTITGFVFCVNDLQFSRFRCFMIGSEAAMILFSFTSSGRLCLEFSSEVRFYIELKVEDNIEY